MSNESQLLTDALSRLRGDTGEIDDGRELPVHVVPAVRHCTRIIYTTKIDWLARLTKGLAEVPGDIAVVWKCGPLGAGHRAVVRAVAADLNAPIRFVGDLDPLDLVTYATMIDRSESWPVPVSYFGISDAWIEQCERDLASRPGMSLRSVSIPMEGEERAAWASIESSPLPWSDAIGQRTSALLTSGLKLELEGASNPDLYSRGFCDYLLRSLFGST